MLAASTLLKLPGCDWVALGKVTATCRGRGVESRASRRLWHSTPTAAFHSKLFSPRLLVRNQVRLSPHLGPLRASPGRSLRCCLVGLSPRPQQKAGRISQGCARGAGEEETWKPPAPRETFVFASFSFHPALGGTVTPASHRGSETQVRSHAHGRPACGVVGGGLNVGL